MMSQTICQIIVNREVDQDGLRNSQYYLTKKVSNLRNRQITL